MESIRKEMLEVTEGSVEIAWLGLLSVWAPEDM